MLFSVRILKLDFWFCFTGLGLALHFNTGSGTLNIQLPLVVKLVTAFTALSITQASDYIHLPQQPEWIFYILGFIKHIIVMYIVVLLRTVVAHWLGNTPPKTDKKL